MSWSLLVYPKYAIVCFFPFSKKKTTSIGEGGGDQRLNERTSTVLRHNNTRPKNITKMISSVQTIASVSALKVRLLSHCFAHSCTIARATPDAVRCDWIAGRIGRYRRVRDHAWMEFLSPSVSFLSSRWGKYRRELIPMRNGPDPLFGDPVRAVRSRL